MDRELDFKLLEGYQGFSAEVVRISLLAIGGVGALYTLNPAESPLGLEHSYAQWFFETSIACNALAVALSLAHRYVATDFLACQVKIDRLRADKAAATSKSETDEIDAETKTEIQHRKSRGKLSENLVLGGPACLAVGSGFLAAAFCIVIANYQGPKGGSPPASQSQTSINNSG